MFSKIKEHSEKALPPVVNSSEFMRIVRLPRRRLIPDQKLISAMSKFFRKKDGTAKLQWIQVAALYEAATYNGLFGPIGVGQGKTLITLLMPTAMDSQKAVLLLPANVRDKTYREIDSFYSKHFDLPLDKLSIHSYHELSQASTADLLEQLQPDLIILDEAHKLKRPQSARTKRFLRYMKDAPECRLVALSGTMANRSVIEYAHLCELALGKNSPLPKGYRELVDWGGAIDVKPMEPKAPGALKRLCEPGETVREGFRRRLIETPGVIATQDEGFAGSLLIQELSLKLPASVVKARKQVQDTWEIGDEVITEATHFGRVMKQLACGFYYRWVWPNNTPDTEWLEARKEWNKELSSFLRYRSRAGLDSAKLVTNAVKRGEITGDIQAAWREWSKVADRPEPETEPVWIDKFMVKAALKWAKKNKRGIIWYEHSTAFEPAFREAGLPVYGGGDDADIATEPLIVCSIKAQGTGKNLQDRYCQNLMLSWPGNGGTVEQVIGRTHRQGQKEDEVRFDWYGHSPEMHKSFQQSIDDARFMQESGGQRQKLLFARTI